MGERWQRWRQERFLKNQFRREQQEARDRAEQSVWRRTGVKRRSVDKALGAGIIAMGVAAKVGQLDDQLGEAIWNQTQTRVQTLDECAEWFPPREGKPRPYEAFLTVPGLGIINGFAFAWPMGKKGFHLPDSDIPMSYIYTSDRGKTPEDVATLIHEQIPNSDELSFYCPSNGGPTLFEALHILKKRGVIVRPRRIILNCAPFDFSDGKSNFFDRALAAASRAVNYKGGPLSKGLFQMPGEISRRGVFGGIWSAMKEGVSGNSPTPWLQDLYNLQGAQLDEYDFTDILTEETEIVFLKAKHDPIVLNDQASGKYKRLVEKYGAKYTEITMRDEATHADPDIAGEDVEQWLIQTRNPNPRRV